MPSHEAKFKARAAAMHKNFIQIGKPAGRQAEPGRRPSCGSNWFWFGFISRSFPSFFCQTQGEYPHKGAESESCLFVCLLRDSSCRSLSGSLTLKPDLGLPPELICFRSADASSSYSASHSHLLPFTAYTCYLLLFGISQVANRRQSDFHYEPIVKGSLCSAQWLQKQHSNAECRVAFRG